jgi:hypothetical protein
MVKAAARAQALLHRGYERAQRRTLEIGITLAQMGVGAKTRE